MAAKEQHGRRERGPREEPAEEAECQAARAGVRIFHVHGESVAYRSVCAHRGIARLPDNVMNEQQAAHWDG